MPSRPPYALVLPPDPITTTMMSLYPYDDREQGQGPSSQGDHQHPAASRARRAAVLCHRCRSPRPAPLNPARRHDMTRLASFVSIVPSSTTWMSLGSWHEDKRASRGVSHPITQAQSQRPTQSSACPPDIERSVGWLHLASTGREVACRGLRNSAPDHLTCRR
ncbi:hypothetical protein DENSPDRAFT_630718 [Dentipellis sp. KUC8613]|nr:hypothetical protein DENSPDRAFT_630718 [Dentipellis sp. KUC8613]